MRVARLALAALLAGAACPLVLAQPGNAPAEGPELPLLPSVSVEASRIPGASVEADQIPGNVQNLSSGDLTRDGSASLTRALSGRLGSINLDANLGDPYQPDVLYRGFEASPVQGTPQGLAVYQNGVRVNEAFGDTVNWDLIPPLAIDQVTLVSASPVYGLNALGGGLAITMKNGFSNSGGDAEASGGSFGQREAAAQYGIHSRRLGLYAAAQALDEDGWRENSRDRLRRVYAVASARIQGAALDLSYSGADNRLAGQGAAPVQELAVSRSLVFTGPQGNDDRLDFLTLSGTLAATDTLSAQALLYYRHYRQAVQNGNTTDYTACANPSQAGSLCQPDGVTPLLGIDGGPLPDLSNGGARTIGENDLEATDAYGRGASLQLASAHDLFGRTNRFAFGASIDDARVNYHSWARLGALSEARIVEPSDLIVQTPEGTPFTATPVVLLAGNRDVGLYAVDTAEATPALSLTAGARYDWARIRLVDRRGSSLSGESRYAHLNPAVGATYRLAGAASAYAGLSQNTRTPTASEIECSDPSRPCVLPSTLSSDPPGLRQVIARTLEIGVRGRGAAPLPLSWQLGVFRTDVEHDIYPIATSLSSGYFRNVGNTRREGVEASLSMQEGASWSGYLNYSFIAATFRSSLTLHSASNPFADAAGNVQVQPGDRLPGIPQHRLKLGLDYRRGRWRAGAEISAVSSQYYFGDESNQLSPLPGHLVISLHGNWRVGRRLALFASIDNLLDARYATYGVLGDPTGVGVPGIPAGADTNGPGVDNRFQSPAAPLAAHAGVRVSL